MEAKLRKRFILQTNPDGTMDGDWAMVCEKIKERNWIRYQEPAYLFESKTIEELAASAMPYLPEDDLIEIPVGSIEFVETYLRIRYGIEGVTPLLIPEALCREEFTARKTAIVHGKEEARAIAAQWNASALFLKSASKLKCDYAGIYKRSDRNWPDDDKMFVSEVVNIISEWRIFVYNQRIVGVKHYADDPWTAPEKRTILRMIKAYYAPGAYTLDVAVITCADGSQRTCILEVHPFISCGLYGFESIYLPDMLIRGFLGVTEAIGAI